MATLEINPTYYARFAYGKNITPPRTDALYHEVHDNPTASGIFEDSQSMYIYQYKSQDIEDNEGYTIHRQGLYFDASSIPDGAITSVTLRFYVEYRYPETASIIIQNGQPTFPHNPGESGDYLYSNYSGNGGEIAYADIVAEAWNTITLNDTGKGWINTSGETKIMLRVSDDINDVVPPQHTGIRARGNYSGYKPSLIIEYTVAEITTQAASEIIYQAAMGNGTIVGGEPTERGFEIRLDFGEYKDSNSGTLANYIDHSIAGFEGDVTWHIVYKWNGVLTKTESETGTFTPEAYELVLGHPSIFGNPDSIFNDKLFKCESYTYRAYMVVGENTYHGDWVAFDTLCADAPPTDDLSEGNPVESIIPIEPGIEPEWLFPEFIWELPEFEFPPWVLPDLPSWEMPDYPPMSFVGDFYYKKPYTKKDLDDLRKKCIIYNKNSVEFALVLRHNMNVLREFFNMMTDYMDKEEFNDFTDLIPPQRLKELYLDPLEVNDFRDMINEFIRNTIDNNMAVNRNFKLIQDGLSDFETESDDAYFREINSNIKTVTEDSPDVHRLKRKIDSLNQEVSMNFSNIMRNLKVLRARLL